MPSSPSSKGKADLATQNGNPQNSLLGNDPEEAEMSFLDHLEELRWHIIRALIAIVSTGIVLFIFQGWLFEDIIYGPTKNEFVSYRFIANAIDWVNATALPQVNEWFGTSYEGFNKLEPPEFKIMTVGFGEAFIMAIKVSFIGGFILSFPYVFWEFWNFIKPGLYAEERRMTRGIVFTCSALFVMGVTFGYFIIAPFGVKFLGGYTLPGVENSTTIGSFINFMVMFTLPAGLIFELPIVVYFLAKVGLATAEGMRTYRRHAIIGVLMIAAVLTPPDVVTQMLIGIPLFILYEASIFIAKRVEKAEAKREAMENGDIPKSKGSLIKRWRQNHFSNKKKK